MKRYQIILFSAIVFFVLGWQANVMYMNKPAPKKPATLLEKIKAKKQLDVIILNSPTVYYMGATQEMGFEYDLISAYANHIGVDLNLTIVHTIEEALNMSEKGIGDITSAGFTITSERKKKFRFGPQYYMVQEQLICNKTMKKAGTFPSDPQDLLGLKIMVGTGTSFVQTLEAVKKDLPEFTFEVSNEFSTEQLLEKVWKKEIDCTLSDSNIFTINQRYYPELVRAFVMTEQKSLGWILREGDASVERSLYEWLNAYERSGKMAELRDSYYTFLNIFDYYNTKVFYKRLKNRLPKYEKYFKEAGEKYNIPWTLLAAISYQESHWNPRAKSYTGVRGMMMLTLATAKQMGVKNRMNAKESIFGGAKYLNSIEKRFPPEIKGLNRWFFTLAAYNVGMGHVHDAQVLARKLNKNPYSWSEMKKVLPLLSQKKYYKHLKYGYARGSEPVRYIKSIQDYVDIIYKKR